MIEHKKSDSRVWIVIIIDKEGNTNYPLLSPNPTDKITKVCGGTY